MVANPKLSNRTDELYCYEADAPKVRSVNCNRWISFQMAAT